MASEVIKKIIIQQSELPVIYKEDVGIGLNGSVSGITGSGPWTATISGLSDTSGLTVGDKITAINGTGSLGSNGVYSVSSITNSSTIVFLANGGTTPIAGTVSSIKNVLLSYNVRYRIISEDKNRTSHWSPVYKLSANAQIPGASYTGVSSASGLVTLPTPQTTEQLWVGAKITKVSGTGTLSTTTDTIVTSINSSTTFTVNPAPSVALVAADINISVPYSYQVVTLNNSLGTNTAINLSWSPPASSIAGGFDIFVKRDSGSFQYDNTIYSTNATIFRIGSETNITLLVQKAVWPKTVTPSSQLFQTGVIAV